MYNATGGVDGQGGDNYSVSWAVVGGGRADEGRMTRDICHRRRYNGPGSQHKVNARKEHSKSFPEIDTFNRVALVCR